MVANGIATATAALPVRFGGLGFEQLGDRLVWCMGGVVNRQEEP